MDSNLKNNSELPILKDNFERMTLDPQIDLLLPDFNDKHVSLKEKFDSIVTGKKQKTR